MGNRIGKFVRSAEDRIKQFGANGRTFVSGATRVSSAVAARTADSALRTVGLGHQTDHLASGRLADPSLPKTLQGLTDYHPVDGRLFVDGAKEGDIGQGMIGDCYFLASLAAVARTKPGFLEQNLKRNDDGTVTVTFYEAGQKVPVTIDADLPRVKAPILNQIDLLAWSHTSNELWPQLYEKAYATWKGGDYEAIGNGGFPLDALESITGLQGSSASFSGRTGADIAQQLQGVLAKGAPVTATTQSEKSRMGGVSGIVENHVYTVDSVEQRGGQWFVKLRNPWANGEPFHVLGKEDGVFELPADQFAKAFYDAFWVE